MVLSASVEDALRRAGVVWVALDGRPARAVWHVWHDGAVHVVAGGDEQDLPGAQDAVRGVVVVRDRGALSGRLPDVDVDVVRLRPGTPEWDAATPVLAARRLNATDAATLPERWARRSVVLRLQPRS